MTIEKEIVGKYNFELKWASYFVIWSFIILGIISILISIYDEFNVIQEDFLGYRYYRKANHTYLLNYIFFILFFYFLIKGFKDAKLNEYFSSFRGKFFFVIRYSTLIVFFYSHGTSDFIYNFRNMELYTMESNIENKCKSRKD